MPLDMTWVKRACGTARMFNMIHVVIAWIKQMCYDLKVWVKLQAKDAACNSSRWGSGRCGRGLLLKALLYNCHYRSFYFTRHRSGFIIKTSRVCGSVIGRSRNLSLFFSQVRVSATRRHVTTAEPATMKETRSSACVHQAGRGRAATSVP